MRKRVLPFDYNASEMDKGHAMVFHPACGFSLRMPSDGFCPTLMRYRGSHDVMREYLPRIGDGEEHAVGSDYPVHWTHCPFTGECVSNDVIGFLKSVVKYFQSHNQLRIRVSPIAAFPSPDSARVMNFAQSVEQQRHPGCISILEDQRFEYQRHQKELLLMHYITMPEIIREVLRKEVNHR